MAVIDLRYSAWIEKLLGRMQVTRRDILDGRLNRDWLLVLPPDQQLSEAEVRDLYNAVQNWLTISLPGRNALSLLRQRIAELSGLASIPLLYAMRQVAYDFGASNRYWPEFNKHLLGNKVDMQAVYFLASDLADLWITLYRLSRRTMFYPSEGPINMKWPTSHAGLLAQHLKLLERYGISLKAETDDAIHPTLEAEIDEFQVELLDWLTTEGEENSDLVRRLRHTDLGLTTALLARRELVNRWSTLRAEHDASEPRQYTKPLRPRLEYDAGSERLNLVFSEGEWAGYVQTVVVQFEKQQCRWSTIYDRRRDITFARRLEIPVTTPDWDEAVYVSVDGEQRRYAIRTSPFVNAKSGGLLFEGATGSRVRTWRPNEHFYLLINNESIDADWIRTLFEDPYPLGKPAGAWDGYLVLWVKSRDVFGTLHSDDQTKKLEELNAILEKAGAALSLPSLNELFRPHLRPVSGMLVERGDGKELCFSSDHPPVFEVRGIWASQLKCTLEKWDGSSQQHLVIDNTLIDTLPVDGPVLVAPFGPQMPVEGRYRIQLQEERLSFSVKKPPVRPVNRCMLHLTLWQDDSQIDGVAHSYQQLETGIFRLDAWPGAVVTLHVEAEGSFATPVCADEAGKLILSPNSILRNLGTATTVRCWASAGPARSEEHVFSSSHRIINHSFGWTSGAFVVEGKIMGPTPVATTTITVLGGEPWQGHERWSQVAHVKLDGSFKATLSVPRDKVRWLIISDSDPKQGAPWLVARIQDGQNLQAGGWRLGNLESWERWEPVADWLAKHGVSLRDLREAVTLSRMARYARQAVKDRANIKPALRAINPLMRADLVPLLMGYRPPLVTLIPASVPLPLEFDGSLNPSSIARHGSTLTPQQAATLLMGRVPTEGLGITIRDGGRHEKATLFPRGSHAFIRVGSPLVFCRKCNHFAPNSAVSSHTSCNRFIPFTTGSEVEVIPAIEWRPRVLTAALSGLMERIVQEGEIEGISDEFEMWLNQLADFFEPTSGWRDPTEWLQDVGELTAGLADMAIFPFVPRGESPLMSLAPVFERERQAVTHLLKRLQAWA